MNTYDQSGEMQKLLKEHAEAKSRMTTGIVRTAIGEFFLILASYTIWLYFIGLIFVIPAIPLLATGIPKLVTGIIRLVKANNRINRYKRQMSYGYNTPNNVYIQSPNYNVYQPQPTPDKWSANSDSYNN